MMAPWSRRHTLIAGLFLIVVTNAVVLVGAAYNRSANPAALLQLTERELRAPGSWGFESENSGFALHLDWRVPADADDSFGLGGSSHVAWLEPRRLAELGFDMSVPADHPQAERHYRRQLSREVLLVMQLNGPAYEAALRRANERAARADANSAEARRLASERTQYSRLFLVDAGLDYDALRARYPDQRRDAIVRGKVRVHHYSLGNKARVNGYVSGLSVAAVNVPLELRGVLDRNASGYTATVAFGRRLEPWLVAARKSEPAADRK